MKYLLDTNIYLRAFRSEEEKARFRQSFYPLLPVTYLSSIVAYELSVNALDRITRELVWAFARPLQQTGRVVVPTFDSWLVASEIVTDIEKKEKHWRSKLPALLNDILIALCASANRRHAHHVQQRRLPADSTAQGVSSSDSGALTHQRLLGSMHQAGNLSG